jgi:RNA polymerase sigma factor (sigma-70 family)
MEVHVVDSNVLTDVRRVAARVARHLPSAAYSRADIEQTLLLRLVECTPRYNPKLASPRTFASIVVRHEAASLIAGALAQKRSHWRCMESLSDTVATAENAGVERIEVISQDDYELRMGRRIRSAVEALHLRMDLDRAVVQLTPELRALAAAIRAGIHLTAASDSLHISRATVHRMLLQLRQAFQTAGLDGYLGTPTLSSARRFRHAAHDKTPRHRRLWRTQAES